MADHECSSRDAAFSSAINESLAWTSVLRPLKKKVAPAPPSEPSAATSANAVRHPHRQARSDDFHPDGTRFLKCRFFMMGTCAKGAKCHFMHWEPAAAPRKSHVHASSSSSSSALLAHQSSSSSVKTAVGPIAANPKSASASASASVLLSAASPIHSSVSMSSSIAPLDSKSCATMAAVESGHSDGDESDDEVQSAGRAPLPARAPQFDGDCETDSELYFYGAPGAQPVPVPVARVDTNNPTAAVSFAKMAARNIVHVPAMAFQLNAVVTSSTSIAAASTVGHGVSSTISLPSTLLSPSVAAPHRKPCVYFAQGSCRFGRVCRDLHSDRATCEHCHQSYPDDAGARDEHFTVCEPSLLAWAEREESLQLTCDICYELVLSAGGSAARFGLLENCAHSFCLSCIREWRASADAVRTEAVRACPICRVESHFVVPCDRFVSDPARKAAIVEEFRTATARISCKHFNAGRGECPFGTSCFYAHVMPDGRPDVPAAPRFMADDEGNVSSIRKVVLADFINL